MKELYARMRNRPFQFLVFIGILLDIFGQSLWHLKQTYMTIRDKTSFHEIARQKGWLLEDIADRWGISVRQMSRVANNPKQRDLDAVSGLPKRSGNKAAAGTK